MSSLQVEASPQAGNFNWRKRLRQDSSGSDSERKAPKLSWNYITLESESPLPSEEDTESVYSVQAHETEYCKDTSDTDWTNYSVDDGDILMQVEYEVDSDFDKSEKFVFGDGGSSSGTEGVVETAVMVATLCDSDLALWADTEDSKSGYSTDSELGHADYWTCVRCKNKNNNPLFRYCEKCYQERKNFFPPRPKGKKKKRGSSRKSDGHRSTCSTTADESVTVVPLKRELSQDSGVATSLSQESIDLMDLATIKIPENLLKQTKLALDTSKPGASNQEDEKVNRDDSLVSVDLVRTEQKVVLYTKSECEQTTDNENEKIEDVDRKFDMKNLVTKDENDKSNLCITCMTQTKDAVFMHSGPLHMCCCYKCAMRVWTECKRCPMCNRKISNVRKVCVA